MALRKIKLKPGVIKDDSPLEADGSWIDADKVRFVHGLPETIGGWEKATTTVMLGNARGAMTWADNGRNPYAAFGTNLRLYAMDLDGNVTDITPVASRLNQTLIKLTTVAGSATLSLAITHGLVTDQKFTFDASAPTTVGGVVIDGTYKAGTITDAYNITFAGATTATGSVGPLSVTSNYTVFLAPGQADGIGGLGFGTGSYGSGGYGSATSGLTYYPRSWTHAAWGQNLISCPRGGSIYEWAPYTASTELVTNGSFTGSATGWTLGAGWAYAANNVTATASSTAAQQNVTTNPASWALISVDVSAWSTGGLQISYAGSNVGSSIVANGTYRTAVFTSGGGAHTLQLTGTNLTATVDNVSMQTEAYANIITNAPTVATGIFVTSERILVAYGVNNDLSSKFDGDANPMRVAWTDQGNNQTWTPASTNLAGSYKLSGGSRIVRGFPAGIGQNLLLSDTSLIAMVYVPDPAVVYSFTEIATGCGLIGPNAVCRVGGRTYWMDPSGGFWAFDGAFPQPIKCPLARDVLDNLAWVQQDKVYAFTVTKSGRLEAWWLYPDSRDGVECSRYVAYAITESAEAGIPVWFNGTFALTSMVESGIWQYPLGYDTSGVVRFYEKGFSADGGARSWLAESAYFDLEDGDSQMRLLGIVPDCDDQQGNYTVEIATRIHNTNGLNTRTYGPYSVMAGQGAVDFRANGQEAKLKFAGNTSPTFWRMGASRLDMEKSGRSK